MQKLKHAAHAGRRGIGSALVFAATLLPALALAQAPPDTVWFRNGTQAVGAMTFGYDRDGVPRRISLPTGDTFAIDYVAGFTMGRRHLRVASVLERGQTEYHVVERVSDGLLDLYTRWGEPATRAAFFETRTCEVLPLTWRALEPHVRDDANTLWLVHQARDDQHYSKVLTGMGGLLMAVGFTDVLLVSGQERGGFAVGARHIGLIGGGALSLGAGIVWQRQAGPRLRTAVQTYGQ